WQDQDFKHDFYVVETPLYQLLLGGDFLQDNNLSAVIGPDLQATLMEMTQLPQDMNIESKYPTDPPEGLYSTSGAPFSLTSPADNKHSPASSFPFMQDAQYWIQGHVTDNPLDTPLPTQQDMSDDLPG